MDLISSYIPHQGSFRIVGHSRVMQNIFLLIERVADSNITVLIQGETGTGKELVSREIHEHSHRLRGRLVQVNCAAIPETLIESELFGHEKGAFTGALYARRGRFEEAHGGTIFLDEIGELSLSAQGKLLRVLQERQVQPLGSSRVINVDVRVIAATNRNLEQNMSLGLFRSDLFYRLNVFPIVLPPLRERGEDIRILADYFVIKYSKELNKPITKISSAAYDAFSLYPWPGNVRELENCIERAILLAPGKTIEKEQLPAVLQSLITPETKETLTGMSSVVESQERKMIQGALEQTHGNQTKAALMLGTTKRIIQYKIKKLGIDYRSFRQI
jgi:Nif-specific regulatory protein